MLKLLNMSKWEQEGCKKNNPKIQHIYHNFATCVKLKIYVNVYFLNCVRPRVKRVRYVSLHPKTFKVNNP